MDIEKAWLEYLELIDTMTKTSGKLPLAILDKRRAEVHKDLSDYYRGVYSDNFNEARFNYICHNLDKIIGFKSPLEGAHELSRRFRNNITLEVGGI
jgi:hypothetical protein